jgi:hypothetical protein
LPINAFAGSVAPALPRSDFSAKGLDVRNATVKALFRQNAQFDFGGVKPTSADIRSRSVLHGRGGPGLAFAFPR